jgi:serine/threonine protein kinase
MAHLDLRPANIFIKSNEGNNRNLKTSKTLRELIIEEIYVLKLGDLGQVHTYLTYLSIYVYEYQHIHIFRQISIWNISVSCIILI